MADKVYLGDAVYAFYDDRSGYLAIQTEDGYEITNRIYLDIEVQAALFAMMQEKLVHDRDAWKEANTK